MATPNGLNPTFDKLMVSEQSVTADAANSSTNTVQAGERSVVVAGVVTDANDWITLPSLSTVPLGHTIVILANAGANFEMRTPASSNEKINDVDSDGSQEYLCTDTDVIVVTKKSSTAWIGVSYTKLGAVRTAVIPD